MYLVDELAAPKPASARGQGAIFHLAPKLLKAAARGLRLNGSYWTLTRSDFIYETLC